MKRRTLLKAAAGAGGLAAVAAGTGYYFRDDILRYGPDDFSKMIRENFSYLNFDVTEEQMAEFHETYIKIHKDIAREVFLRIKGYDDAHVYEQHEHMYLTFLKSTDFFLNGADESKPVKYISFADPYLSPCWNPIGLAAAAEAAKQA